MSMSTLSLSSAHVEAPARLMRLLSLKPAPAGVTLARRISSQVLLEGARELVIQHQGSEYHLRLTRNDKLILTK
ncbi:hemin uptake protein HemP [Dyella tabacisoli]